MVSCKGNLSCQIFKRYENKIRQNEVFALFADPIMLELQAELQERFRRLKELKLSVDDAVAVGIGLSLLMLLFLAQSLTSVAPTPILLPHTHPTPPPIPTTATHPNHSVVVENFTTGIRHSGLRAALPNPPPIPTQPATQPPHTPLYLSGLTRLAGIKRSMGPSEALTKQQGVYVYYLHIYKSAGTSFCSTVRASGLSTPPDKGSVSNCNLMRNLNSVPLQEQWNAFQQFDVIANEYDGLPVGVLLGLIPLMT